MNKFLSKFFSDNLKSAIQKRPRGPKWLGLSVIACVLLIVGATAQAQGKLPKIGWLAVRPASAAFAIKSFQREFSKLGYFEGKNIAFEYRYAEGKLERLPALADELVRLKVDVIIAPNTPAAIAAKNATKTIPIVFIDVTDPIAAGLVDSLPRPGGNITGFTTIGSVLAGKRLELLKETIPQLSRVAVLWNPQDSSSAQSWKESQLPARELGLQLHSMEVSNADKYEAAFKEATKARSGALVWMSSPLGSANQRLTVDLAEKYRLPAIYAQAKCCREWWPDVLRNRPGGSLQTSRCVRRQDFERNKTCGHSRRAADEVRAGNQPQDRE